MEAFLSHCATSLSYISNSYVAFLFGGITGGFTHCLPMCGSFAACERACAGKACGFSSKAALQAIALPYHLGRFTTYGLLGFFVALLAQPLQAYPWWPAFSSTLLVIAGLLFLFNCFRSCSHDDTTGTPHQTYWRGTLLGFMPCGLLYAALMMAATFTHPLQGMMAMWLFTLGTIPALVIASGGAHLLRRKWDRPIRLAGRGMMALNGLSLVFIATHPLR